MNYPLTNFTLSGDNANKKQLDFFEAFMMCEAGDFDYRYLFYGGAIRGGKSFLICFLLHILHKKYPNSKSVVVRKDLPTLKKTTIPTFRKMLGAENVKKHGEFRWSSPISFNYHNGSQILFIPESISQDSELDSFLGVECNFFFLEQIEELTHKMFDMAKQRVGSHYLPTMPNAYIFSTFNPTNRWVKKEVYDKYNKSELKSPYYYLEALPSDNPHITKDQWANWQQLDSRTYKQMIEADWAITMVNDNRFIYSYSDEKHMNSKENQSPIDKTQPIYLSFDFNVNPQVCIVCQHDAFFSKVRILKEYRMANSGVYEICERIKKDFDTRFCIVTGDPAGWSRDARSKGTQCHYEIIQRELHINWNQIKAPRSHPLHKTTRTMANSILEKHNDFKFNDLPFLINDLLTVEANDEGGIKKIIGENGHLLDAFLYYIFTFGKNYLGLKTI